MEDNTEDKELKFISDITVKEIRQCGDDRLFVGAARAYDPDELTQRYNEVPPEDEWGLLNYMMKHRHGSCYEHGFLSVYAHAPAFVWWEWVRHRWMSLDCSELSFNLESGRYHELEPVFWVPRQGRKMTPSRGHKPARPKFDAMDEISHQMAVETMHEAYHKSWEIYKDLLFQGVAAEVARSVLGFGVYYSGWTSCNPRSLMHFISLRTYDPNAKMVSYPQAEIEEAARQCEEMLKTHWPLTWKAFNENGRVAP